MAVKQEKDLIERLLAAGMGHQGLDIAVWQELYPDSRPPADLGWVPVTSHIDLALQVKPVSWPWMAWEDGATCFFNVFHPRATGKYIEPDAGLRKQWPCFRSKAATVPLAACASIVLAHRWLEDRAARQLDDGLGGVG